MNKITATIIFSILALPAIAFAHATPLEMHPRSGSQLQESPTEISIRFSERLESASSRIKVTDESGARVEEGVAHVSDDGYTLSAPLRAPDGIYAVTWSVVSQDDGHFTRGSYAFSVGARAAPTASSEEVVKIAGATEATLMFIEFVGNSILWGILALYLLSGESRLRKMFSVLALCAAASALIGSGGQLLLKSHELAGLHATGLWDAFHLYSHTVAGHSTIVRGIALVLGGIGAALLGFRSKHVTVAILGIPLLVFAYYRAIVSHATANPFFPDLSIWMNFVHVIEKDLWLGVLFVFCVILASRHRESIVPSVLPRTVALLSANLAVLSASAGYIVWLHLKSFSNIVSTAWGQAFLPLAVCAFFLIALHTYHVVGLRFRPHVIKKYLAATFGGMCAAAAFVVFFSSVVIITSPPPHESVREFSSTDKGTEITLSRAPYDDTMALLTVTGPHEKPTVVIGARDGGLQPVLIQRFEGGYMFPWALVGAQNTVTVIAPRPGSYDAQVSFELSSALFAKSDGHGRTFDFFTLSMLVLTLIGIVYSIVLRYLSSAFGTVEVRHAGPRALIGALLASVAILGISGGTSVLLKNEFEAACVNDGNMWHMMQPTYEGVPTLGEAREGCMWGMGKYFYQFADQREYEYLSSLGTTTVRMDTLPLSIRAGVPAKLKFTLRNADGTPATLLVDMEKYIHVVVVSKDESVFAHIHPDDVRPLTEKDINSSTFTVEHTFPTSGEYLVSVDFAHGTQLESKQFTLQISGSPAQVTDVRTYVSPGVFRGYTVALDHGGARAEEVTTLRFNVSKDGVPVTTLQPYLSAVSHVSVVKDDLSEFIHTHGEYHAPGTPYPPVVVRNGKIIHSMSSMTAPATFGPAFEAHVLFPSRGRYTVWAQINTGTEVVPTSFTVDVE